VLWVKFCLSFRFKPICFRSGGENDRQIVQEWWWHLVANLTDIIKSSLHYWYCAFWTVVKVMVKVSLVSLLVYCGLFYFRIVCSTAAFSCLLQTPCTCTVVTKLVWFNGTVFGIRDTYVIWFQIAKVSQSRKSLISYPSF